MISIHAHKYRPRGMGEILDQAIVLLRRNFLTFIGIAALVQVPLTLLSFTTDIINVGSWLNTLLGEQPYSLTTAGIDWDQPGYVITTLTLYLIALVLVQSVGGPALVHTTMDSLLGQPAGLWKAYREGRSNWLPVTGATLLATLLLVGGGLLIIIPCIGWISGAGFITFMALVILPLIPPFLVLEQSGVFAGLRRVWQLAHQRFWWLLGFTILLLMFQFLVVMGPMGVLALILEITAEEVLGTNLMANYLALYLAIGSVTSLGTSLLVMPLRAICTTLVYLDLRTRLEGLDLAQAAEQTNEHSLETIRTAPRQLYAPLFAWKQAKNIILLSLAEVSLAAAMIISLYLFFALLALLPPG